MLPLVEQVGDVLAAEGSILQGIDQGLLHSFQAVDFDQRQDLAGVMSGIKMAGLQLLIILGGSVAQRQEAHQ